MVDSRSANVLRSYLKGAWHSGNGEGVALHNPSTGEVVARADSSGVELAPALEFSRRVGGPALRQLTLAQRGELLRRVADLLLERRARWSEIAQLNSGNTKADAAVDVDGAIGTLKYFARLASNLAEAGLLTDGGAVRLTRDPNFEGIHLGVPVEGTAVHINAFNFPAWGLWEKAAVSLLAGVPVLTKPATSTAWLAHDMVAAVIEARILPEGSLSLLAGGAADLLDHLRFGDVVAFTGSAATADLLRDHTAFRRHGVRLNIEADSLNAAVLGPGEGPDAKAFELLCREVVREMTSKAGQKCTAIRRVMVPREVHADVCEAIAAQLNRVVVGNPAEATVTMGPLATAAQRRAVEEGIRALQSGAQVVFQQDPAAIVGADATRGAFVGPVLFRAPAAFELPHEIEVFGPVATVVPYSDEKEAFALTRAAGGSLTASVFSADHDFLVRAAAGLGATHGRLLLVDPAIGDSHTGHGIVLPSCTHGGPGRAGGGEELGGLRGLWFYHQRVAVQASAAVVARLAREAVNTYAS